MGSGWQEWPLVLFTVLGQCVAGGLIVTGLAWFTGNQNDRARIVRVMFFLWVLMGIAFLASVMHLGSPLRAFNSLNRLGHSPLSNEIASGSLFFAVGGLWWLVAVLGKMPTALGKAWLIVAMALGVVFIFAMTRVYQIDTVPTWHNGYTTLGFFLTAFLGGPLLGALLLGGCGHGDTADMRRGGCAGAGDKPRGGADADRKPCGHSQHRTAGERPAAGLRLLAGVAHGAAGARHRLLALPAGTSRPAASVGADGRVCAGAGGRAYRSWPFLWPAYDGGYGRCGIIFGRRRRPFFRTVIP